MAELAFHLGYPKTATTTLQTRLFPVHPEIDYAGKMIPSHRYVDERLFPLLHSLMTDNDFRWDGGAALRDIVRRMQEGSSRKVLLFSSENFLHAETFDIKVVAERLKLLFPDAKILIAFRNQLDLMLSFYRSHGAFAEYLFFTKARSDPAFLPLTIEQWLEYQLRSASKNVLGTLYFGEVATIYSELFSPNVLFLLSEEFCTDPASYLAKLCRFLGIGGGQVLGLAIGEKDNPGLTRVEFAEMAAELRRSYAAALGSPECELAAAQGSRGPEWPSAVPEPWSSIVGDLFRPGNRRLLNEFGLAVDRFGYPQ